MLLQTARTIVCQDRMDWHKPHLTWLPNGLYRYFLETRR